MGSAVPVGMNSSIGSPFAIVKRCVSPFPLSTRSLPLTVYHFMAQWPLGIVTAASLEVKRRQERLRRHEICWSRQRLVSVMYVLFILKPHLGHQLSKPSFPIYQYQDPRISLPFSILPFPSLLPHQLCAHLFAGLDGWQKI